MKRSADVEITGAMGFYALTFLTPAAKQFGRLVEGYSHGTAYCDDTRMTQDLADGAISEGLAVLVNGKSYAA